MAKLYDEIVPLNSPRLAARYAFNTMPDHESCVKLEKRGTRHKFPQRQILIYQKSRMCSALLALRITRMKKKCIGPFPPQSSPINQSIHASIHPSIEKS